MTVVNGSDRQSIFSLYNKNNETTYFWLKRFSWERTIGYVISIGTQDQGSLDNFGKPPYYGNPDVIMAYFSDSGELKNISTQSAPGAFSWSPVNEPSWWNDELEELVFSKYREFCGYESY
jgi:hypothetical protein